MTMTATLFDYDAGNLHSLSRAIFHLGYKVKIETNPKLASHTDILILPGVGAFGLAAKKLAEGRRDMFSALQKGLPCIGICLGMQLLFDSSEEGEGSGLSFVSGRVRQLQSSRTPHMGWTEVKMGETVLGTYYFANRYVCEPADPSLVRATFTVEKDRAPAIIRYRNTIGFQFHPEKSSKGGLDLLAFALHEIVKGETYAFA